MKKLCLTFFVALWAGYSFAQFKFATFAIDGYKLPYRVQFPANYDSEQQYPLVVFLHGSGEKGNDNEKQLVHGGQFLTDNFTTTYPAIVIVPQCPTDNYWANVIRHEIDGMLTLHFGVTDKATYPMTVLQALINDWIASGKVDVSRVYVGGLSMGGMGTLELLWRMPHTFAAAFPICGGGDLSKLPLFAHNTAVWLFHGDADSAVPVQNSREIYIRLKELGCNVKYSEYPGVGHNSWDNAFTEKNLPAWLFEQRLGKK